MFINWGSFLVILSLMGMTIFFFLFYNDTFIVIEYFLLSILNLDVKFYFLIDWISTLFSSVVMFISGMVILYSHDYMKEDKNKNSFCWIVLLFVLSMIFLIIMPNMFMLILGWDGLGLVSYCLVIYYQSVNSYNSGMITIISNRVGDVMIILSLIFFVNFGSFDLLSLSQIELICGILILIAGLTKSAQIPFSAWLPAAMAAPTPVSSLVHSSTLVTAGVYLLMRFNFLFHFNFFSSILMKISLLTMLMAGINAFFETDFKKIIAFSTLSQLSLMMISISLGMMELAFFHLIMHAIFKSMLFLCAGLIIHSFNGIQDIRMLGNFFSVSPLISSCMSISILSLMGFPFIGGFYSKDLIVEFFIFKINNLILILIFYIGILFTFFYCSRLIYTLLLKSTMNLTISNFNFQFMMVFPITNLCAFMIISGGFMNWIINPNFSLIFIDFECKSFTLIFLVISIFFFIFIKNMNFYSSKLEFFFKIWHLNFMTSFILLNMSKKLSILSLSDWTWMEILGPSMIKNNFNLLYNFSSWMEIKNFNKILLILMMTVIICL
uniref:NADH dehydrogenase subunit 5 n=1 Tax=Amblyomma hebraeum TaxID=34608 RepID=UPI002237CBE1|nr:NADH dehydrogenase subunit 5 [Amblyomma hebraeum]QLD96941.1 NADH dehydrogenase subunit 5 [Amblyomma hebraeum]UYB77932.1 NADH dehydrogenase subunit 5 [Amblyomma hebraeum]